MTGERAERVDEAARIIAASPADVYSAFASRHALESWLPPAGMTGEVHDFAFRDGGGYRMRLTYRAPGQVRGKTTEDADVVSVRFAKLDADRCIEQIVDFDSPQPEFAGSMTMTWSFTAVDGGTEVSIRCENVPAGIRPEDHAVGLASSLDNLANFVERAASQRPT